MDEDNPFKRKMAEDKARKQREAEQRQQEKEAAARAKAEAKRKAQRAVEDDWFMDGEEDNAIDSDDDFGMMDLSQAAAATAPKAAAPSKFVVKNLIDWGDCNTAGESAPEPSPPPIRGGMASSSGASASSPFRAESASAADHFAFSSAGAPGHVANCSSAAADAQEVEKLRDECEHLRAMLSDANEMRNIEMDILKDEKQAVIDGLKKQSEDAQRQRDELQKLNDELRASNQDELRASPSSPTLLPTTSEATQAALDKEHEQNMATQQQRDELQRQFDKLQAFSRAQSEELQLLRSAAPPPPPPPAEVATEEAKQQILEAQKERDELKRHLDDLGGKQQILEAQKEPDELKRQLDELQAQSRSQAKELEALRARDAAPLRPPPFAEGLENSPAEQPTPQAHAEGSAAELQKLLDKQVATVKERDELQQLLNELQAQSRSQTEELAALRAKAAEPPPPLLVEALEDPLCLFEDPLLVEPSSQVAEMAQLREQASGALEKHSEELRGSNAAAGELRLEVARLQQRLATPNEEAAELRKEVVRLHAESTRAVQAQELEQVQSEQLKAQLEELHSWSGRAVQAARSSEGQLKAQLEQLQQETELNRAKLQEVEAENQLLQATPAEAAMPASIAALLMEVKGLLLRSQHSVAETKPDDALAWDTALCIGDVEAQLQHLRSMASALQSDLEAYQERERDKSDKQTASKIQEIRLNAEKQLSWLKRRTRMGSG